MPGYWRDNGKLGHPEPRRAAGDSLGKYGKITENPKELTRSDLWSEFVTQKMPDKLK
jgi:hypothetical protein